MRDLCDYFAEQGFVAVCPDLFWRIEPGVDITDKTDEEWQKAFDLMGKFDVDQGVEDLRSTLAFVREFDATTGKAGSVGYCLGGKLAYLMATRSDSDANVGYYGVGIAEILGEAQHISAPLILHVATEDGFVGKDEQAKMHEALDPHPQVTLHDYDGCDHAFAREGGAHYDAEAAKQANQRTLDLFNRALR
jgi:carboxymethylenebutenolidase